eukprot:TRINITY_DN32566_c0_g1_i3.p1 TRINITY_DN32566_c0_g1~~TRINITY_DN32566_c0_g1_i3.p1  ORF type:complete len:228 (-),score=26.13 TRINITY_DN32566_c0_g1_i3:172-855(-)
MLHGSIVGVRWHKIVPVLHPSPVITAVFATIPSIVVSSWALIKTGIWNPLSLMWLPPRTVPSPSVVVLPVAGVVTVTSVVVAAGVVVVVVVAGVLTMAASLPVPLSPLEPVLLWPLLLLHHQSVAPVVGVQALAPVLLDRLPLLLLSGRRPRHVPPPQRRFAVGQDCHCVTPPSELDNHRRWTAMVVVEASKTVCLNDVIMTPHFAGHRPFQHFHYCRHTVVVCLPA